MIGAPVLGLPQREAAAHALIDLASEDPRLLVLDGDLGTSTRTDLFAARHPERFLQMGIAEQNMVGVAAGLATVGYVPFVTTFACFAVHRALDAVRVLVAQPSLDVKIAAGYSGLLTGLTGKTHQAVDDLAIMRAMPHMRVLVPGDDLEARAAIAAALALPGPVYVRLTRDAGPRIRREDETIDLARAVALREGHDVGIIATGAQTARALEAAALLEADGIAAGVLHVPSLKPLDEAGVLAYAARHRRIVTSEEHTVIGGLGGAVAELLGRHRPMPVLRHGIEDTFGQSAPNQALLERYRLSASWLAEAVRSYLKEMS